MALQWLGKISNLTVKTKSDRAIIYPLKYANYGFISMHPDFAN